MKNNKNSNHNGTTNGLVHKPNQENELIKMKTELVYNIIQYFKQNNTEIKKDVSNDLLRQFRVYIPKSMLIDFDSAIGK